MVFPEAFLSYTFGITVVTSSSGVPESRALPAAGPVPTPLCLPVALWLEAVGSARPPGSIKILGAVKSVCIFPLLVSVEYFVPSSDG